MKNKRWMQAVIANAAIAMSFLMSACGGSGSSASPLPSNGASGGGTNGAGKSTAVALNFTDSPSDRVVAFELTINSVTLTRSDNSTVALLSAPRRVEVTHASGTAEPLSLPAIPQGTYTSATIVVSAADVVFIDNAGHEVEKKDRALTKTIVLPLNPPLTVGATPLVLLIDFDASASITMDVATGTVTFNPAASFTNNNIAQLEHEQEVENGEFEHITGSVSASSANSFTITTSVGTSITFATNASTSFEGAANASSLTANLLVRVEGRMQMDGTLLAKEVEVLSNAGTEAEGLITDATGNPVSSFSLVLQDGNGSGMGGNTLGTQIAVNVTNRTRFRVDKGNINLSGLNLPTFSAASLSKGQRVEAESDNPVTNGTLSAESLKLQQQALVGAVSAINGAQFTLTVPDDSAFKLLTGKNTLTVVTQSNTNLKNGIVLSTGALVKVRGLVFLDPAQTSFTMVAGRISKP